MNDSQKMRPAQKQASECTKWLNLNYMWMDRPSYDFGEVPPEIIGILAKGKRGRIFCTYLTAGNPRPKPTVIICHGYPGNEQNFDVAATLRRVGFNVMTFHYSGSWGSDGNFSFANCIEDATTVLDLLLHSQEPGAADRYTTDGNLPNLYVDTDRIAVLGHSMGGMVAYHLLAQRPEIKAAALVSPADFGQMVVLSRSNEQNVKTLRDVLDSGIDWLCGTSGEALLNEAEGFADGNTFIDKLEAVSNRRLAIIAGSKDTITPIDTNVKPLLDKAESTGCTSIDLQVFGTDHMFSDSRCQLCEASARFFVDALG